MVIVACIDNKCSWTVVNVTGTNWLSSTGEGITNRRTVGGKSWCTWLVRRSRSNGATPRKSIPNGRESRRIGEWGHVRTQQQPYGTKRENAITEQLGVTRRKRTNERGRTQTVPQPARWHKGSRPDTTDEREFSSYDDAMKSRIVYTWKTQRAVSEQKPASDRCGRDKNIKSVDRKHCNWPNRTG